ncbi:uncharacterized protein LOC110861973 [Folsomia candida]|uniref:Uncharacterized protein n=1 Tax=Folsomia candida TaxID=158441 RepID=A0A226D0P3_FOLCA|nr:uncharacterized protein LOC110861973 [Folsomia candida]OXA38287.1 hypothetical protein Fcan01_27059 [Folsomia candida]
MGSPNKFTGLLRVFLMAALFSGEDATVIHPVNPIWPLGIVDPTPTRCQYSETATFAYIELTNCTQQPCLISTAATYQISPTFTPGYTANTMTYYLYLNYGTGSHNFGTMSFTEEYLAGNQYKIVREILIPSELRGRSGYFLLMLVDSTALIHISRCFNATVAH